LVVLPTASIIAVNAIFGGLCSLAFGPWGLAISFPVALISGFLVPAPYYRRYFEEKYRRYFEDRHHDHV
jgi:hypothetical protein